jgi:hypothetical protein
VHGRHPEAVIFQQPVNFGFMEDLRVLRSLWFNLGSKLVSLAITDQENLPKRPTPYLFDQGKRTFTQHLTYLHRLLHRHFLLNTFTVILTVLFLHAFLFLQV